MVGRTLLRRSNVTEEQDQTGACTCPPPLDNETLLRKNACPVHGIKVAEKGQHASEVARILVQIQAEYEASYSGLHGLAQGSSRHAFITARMESMGRLHEELAALVGERSIGMVALTLENVDGHSHTPLAKDVYEDKSV
jgi:hypothetical protein